MTLIYRSCLALTLSINNQQQFTLIHNLDLSFSIHNKPLRTQRHVNPSNMYFIPFFLKSCLKTTRIYFPTTYRKHPISHFDDPRFKFYVYDFDLSDRMWFVSLVLRIYPHTRRSLVSNHHIFQGYPRLVISILFCLKLSPGLGVVVLGLHHTPHDK